MVSQTTFNYGESIFYKRFQARDRISLLKWKHIIQLKYFHSVEMFSNWIKNVMEAATI